MELERLQIVIEASTAGFKNKMKKIKELTNSTTKSINNMGNSVDTKAIDKLNCKIKTTQDKLSDAYAQLDDIKYKANEGLKDMPFKTDNERDSALDRSLSGNKNYAKIQNSIRSLEMELERYKVTLEETEKQHEKSAKRGNGFADSLNKIKSKLKDVKNKTKSMNIGFKDTLEKTVPLTKSFFRLSNMLKLMAIRMVLRGTINAVRSGFQDLAKANSDFNNSMSQCQSVLLQARNSLATAFAPVLQALTPIIVTVTNAFINAFNIIGMVSARLFGNATTFAKAKKVSMDYAKSLDGTANSAKKARTALAGIDEINNLNTNNEVSTQDTGMPEATEMFTTEIIPEDEVAFIDSVKEKIDGLKASLSTISFSKLSLSFDGLVESASPLTKDFFSGLEWGYNNLFIPLAKWTVQDILPNFLDLVSASICVLHSATEQFKPTAEWMWNTFLAPFATFVGGIIIDFIKGLTEKFRDFSDWAKQNKDVVQTVADIVLAFLSGLWIYNTTKNIIGFITNLGPALATLSGKIALLITPANLAAIAVGALFAGITVLALNWDKLTPTQRTITLLGALAAAATAAAIAVALFHTAWSIGIAAAAIAGGIALIGGTLLFKNNNASLGTSTNASMSDARAFSSYNFSSSPLPAFAEGGVLHSPTVGLLAEYPGASTNPEIIAPENKIRKIVREESESFDDSEILTVLGKILDAMKQGKILAIDGEEFANIVNSTQSGSFRSAGRTLVNI